MIIRFYSIAGKTEAIENELRSIVNDIKVELAKRGIGEDKVRLTIIKVRGDVTGEVVKYLDQPEGKIPGQYRSLIVRMRQDGVSTFPALVINDRKVAEGDELTIDVVKSALLRELKDEFNLELPAAKPAEQPQPAQPAQPPQPVQPVTPPPPPIEVPPPQIIQPQPVRPVAPPPPPPPQETQQPPSIPPLAQQPQLTAPQPQLTQPIQPIPAPIPQPAQVSIGELRFKVINGRPDDCNDCVYYGRNKGYCYLFGLKVVDPLKPPCKSIA